MSSIFNTILKGIEELQVQNRKNPNVKTADPSVFTDLRERIGGLQTQTQNQNYERKKTSNILEQIADIIKSTQNNNKSDPNVKTADKTIFKELLRRVQKPQKKLVKTGLAAIVAQYNLDVSRLPQNTLKEISNRYSADLQIFNKKYAQAIYNLTRQVR